MSIVKNSAYEICQEAKHVVINDDALESFITNTQSKVIEFIPWEAWPTHYVGPNQLDYIFALDALNFCFWPKEAFEYDNLAQNLKNIIQRDLNGLSPLSLAHMSDHYISSEIFQDQHFPMISERCRLLRELGQKTLDGFDGDFKNMISACKNSAEKVNNHLVSGFSNSFLSRIQRCVYLHRSASVFLQKSSDFSFRFIFSWTV